MIDYLIQSLIFFGTGLLALWYFRFVPSREVIQQRLPNRVSAAGLVLTAVIIAAVWYIATRTGGFSRAAWITTLLYVLLVFETVLLPLLRKHSASSWLILGSLLVAALPFVFNRYFPSFVLVNALIVVAALGATALLVRIIRARPWLLAVLCGVFAINDVMNVLFLYPQLPLGPITNPPRLLLFPTIVVGQSVVGVGDIMFVALTTLILQLRFGRRVALLNAGIQAFALLIVGWSIVGRDVLVPLLAILVPVFGGVYLFAKLHTTQPPKPRAVVGT